MKTKIALPFKDDLPVRRFKSCLDEFLPKFQSYLDGSIGKGNYDLIMVEEHSPETTTFNLGRTINIAFDVLKSSMEDSDMFMFHPIDILPIDTNYAVEKNTKFCMLGYKPFIFHVFKSQKFLDGHYYYKFLCMKKHDYEKVNGFTNKFVGWGGEDDEFFLRLEINKVELDAAVNEYTRLTHDGSNGPNYGTHKELVIEEIKKGSYSSGLSDLKYDLLDISEEMNVIKYLVR